MVLEIILFFISVVLILSFIIFYIVDLSVIADDNNRAFYEPAVITHIGKERHHIPACYHTSLLNTKEGFLRILASHSIKIKKTHIAKDGSVETIFLKGKRKTEQISISIPYTMEKFYLLSGFVMKSFCIPKEIMIKDGFDMAICLPGFNNPEYTKSIEWCNTNDISAIRKTLISE